MEEGGREGGGGNVQDHVHGCVANDHVLRPVNHTGKDSCGRRERVVVSVYKDRSGTLVPHHAWGMDGILHIRPVEVNGCAFREVVERSGEAEDVPEQGTSRCHLVDIEARIGKRDSVDHVEVDVDTASIVDAREVLRSRKKGGRWEGEVFLAESRVSTVSVAGADVRQEGIVEGEKTWISISSFLYIHDMAEPSPVPRYSPAQYSTNGSTVISA